MDIVHQLRSQTHKLSPTEQLIAQACLDDLGFAASATIDQLAQRAGVSRSALSRFAKTVGCRDIREMRMQLAQAGGVGRRFLVSATPLHTEAQDTSLPTSAAIPTLMQETTQETRQETTAAQHAPPIFFRRIVSDIETALHRHLDVFDAETVAQAVSLMAHAQMVYAFGVGGASSMGATELQHRLVRLGAPIAAYHDPILMRMASAAVSAQDVVVALSLSGITPDLLAAVKVAKRYGAKVLAITPRGSALSALADIVIPMIVDETDFIYKPTAARYGMLLAIDILVTELALLQPDHHQERLRRVKLALDDYRRGDERLPLGD